MKSDDQESPQTLNKWQGMLITSLIYLFSGKSKLNVSLELHKFKLDYILSNEIGFV